MIMKPSDADKEVRSILRAITFPSGATQQALVGDKSRLYRIIASRLHFIGVDHSVTQTTEKLCLSRFFWSVTRRQLVVDRLSP
jgi:hypothetical protein